MTFSVTRPAAAAFYSTNEMMVSSGHQPIGSYRGINVNINIYLVWALLRKVRLENLSFLLHVSNKTVSTNRLYSSFNVRAVNLVVSIFN